MEGAGDLPAQAPIAETDPLDPHYLIADSDAETAQVAQLPLAFRLKPGGLYPVGLGQLLELDRTGTFIQQQLHNPAAHVVNPVAAGQDLDALPNGVNAGDHHPGSAAVVHLHYAEPAAPVRLHRGVITEGGNVDAVEFGHFQNGPALLACHFLIVNSEADHAQPSS